MAKMYGRRGREHWHCKCCDPFGIPKSHIKNQEESQWQKEVVEEMWEDHKHDRGMCYDPKSGMYGCDVCGDLDDAYDNSDLDEIPGVWCDVDWRRSLTEADFWFMEEWDDRIANVRKRREIEQAWKQHDAENGNSSSGSVRTAG